MADGGEDDDRPFTVQLMAFGTPQKITQIRDDEGEGDTGPLWHNLEERDEAALAATLAEEFAEGFGAGGASRTIQLFAAPISAGSVNQALWWCDANDRRHIPSQRIPFADIISVVKGTTSTDDEERKSADEDECFSLASATHTLNLQAVSPAVRDAWISAVCTVLELGLKKRRTVNSPGTTAPLTPSTATRRRVRNDSVTATPSVRSRGRSNVNSVPSALIPAVAPDASSTSPAAAASPAPSSPALTGKALAKASIIAYDKAQMIRAVQHSIVQMTASAAELMRTTFSKDGVAEASPSQKEFDSVLKLHCSAFTAVTPSPSDSFEAKAYAPTVFSRIRALYGVADASYVNSILDTFVDLIVNSKSGSFFFYTRDGRYLLKTCTVEENKALCHMLPSYFQHLQANPDSLLIKMLGSYRMKMKTPHSQTLHFQVMHNVFHSPQPIHIRFDLKGSSYGRAAKEEEKKQGVPVLKDNDFFDGCTFPDGRKLPPTFLMLGSKKAAFLRVLSADADYLRHSSIMDYSLLLGVHYSNAAASAAQPANGDSKQLPRVDESRIPAGSSSSNKQTNYGVKPQKEVIIPRQLLRKATMVMLAEEKAAANGQMHGVDAPAAAPPRVSVSAAASKAPPLPQHRPRMESSLLEADGSITSEDEKGVQGEETYYVGVIDILQQYTAAKKLEQTFKSIAFSSAAVSCADPYFYRERFIRRISSHVLGNDAVEDADEAEDAASQSEAKRGPQVSASNPAESPLPSPDPSVNDSAISSAQ